MKQLYTSLLCTFSFFAFAQQDFDTFVTYPGCENENDLRACFYEKTDEHIKASFNVPDDLIGMNSFTFKASVVFGVNGLIDYVEIVKSVDQAVDEEAMRVILSLPRVQPAMKDGESIPLRVIIPIHYTVDENEEILKFDKVEKKPVFPGCEKMKTEEDRHECFNMNMMKHVAANFKFPSEAREDKAQGVVVVSFIVEKDGSVKEASVLRSVHPALDAEAVRVMLLLPRFQPAEQRGKPVRMQFNMPINAKLQ